MIYSCCFFSVIRAKRTLRIKEKKNYLAKLTSLANVFCFTFFLVCLCVLLVFSSFSEKYFSLLISQLHQAAAAKLDLFLSSFKFVI